MSVGAAVGAKSVANPFFLDTPEGRLFAVYHRPATDQPIRGQVLCVAPFNEEMNRCRSMVTLQARALAKLGIATLVVDLVGTGDSSGDFVEGRWDLWLANLNAAKAWLDSQGAGGYSAIWGIRLGGLLATELQQTLADKNTDLVLWQPVIDGKTHLTQFFRVRIAAQLDRVDLPKETTASMREQLANGIPVEVAGYEIHPQLAQAIDAAKLAKLAPVAGSSLLWLENASPEKQEVSPATKSFFGQWPSGDVKMTVATYAGPAFWQVHERVLAPEIISQTTAWVAQRMQR